jgi:beta-galactosidase
VSNKHILVFIWYFYHKPYKDMSIRSIFMLAGILIFLSLPAFSQASFGEPVKINNGWKFLQEDVKDGQLPDLNDSRWRNVQLPHDWSIRGQHSPTLASATGYLPGGIGWYRKKLSVPAEAKDKKVYLYFEGVYNRSEVFINGHSLGKRPNGYISFTYDATPYIRYGEENSIAVRVDHSQSADSRWYTGSGIYRDVYAIYANPVHIAPWGVFAHPTVNGNKGTLHIEVAVDNETQSKADLQIVTDLLDKNGKVVATKTTKFQVSGSQQATLKTDLALTNPQLWSLENPNLYTLRTTIKDKAKVWDESTTQTGFRTFAFDPDKGFALNGNWMKMKGVCIHHDAGVLGAAVPREVWRRRLLTLKEVGVNAIRTSHNPQSPDLYQLCDELGLLVVNEAFDEWEYPKRKWLQGWNVGTPGFEGIFDFFEEWGERDLADMVRRDRNHISIFAWSIGNEVDYPNDPYSHPVLDGKSGGFTQPIFGGYKKDAPDAMRLGGIAKRLAAVVRKYDSSRPVTAGVAMSNETEYPAALDIAGYNYTESKYAEDHAKYPKRVIYGSENRHDLNAWKAVRDNDYIFGQFLWTGIDYLGESGRWPSRGFYSGLLDFGGFIKPRGYYRQSLWAEKPMAYLGTYPTPGKGSRSQGNDVWSQLEGNNRQNYEEKVPSIDAWPLWNYRSGQLIRVVSYTNGAKAKLELNGKLVGEEKPYDENTGIIFWDIPYEAGKLEVIASDKNGKETARYAITSSGRPHKLEIVSVDKTMEKDGGVAQIILEVKDEKGIPVRISDDEITVDIAGPATLLGLEASNNQDMTDYTDNKHRVFHGKIVVYLRSKGENGKVNVRFTSPWLQSAETVIEVK